MSLSVKLWHRLVQRILDVTPVDDLDSIDLLSWMMRLDCDATNLCVLNGAII